MIKKHKSRWMIVVTSLALSGSALAEEGLRPDLTQGKFSSNFNLRFESVEQDNALDDATALTLRSRMSYQTRKFEGFSALLEIENTSVYSAQDDYSVGPTGFNVGQYSVIADPENTEIDQGYVQYETDKVVARLGRQVITHDGHRFVGNVGWRQDRQTFDALTVQARPQKNLLVNYSYITKRNRIFSNHADLDSKDHLLNVSYDSSLGKLVGYAYRLEVDRAGQNSLHTYGVRLTGSTTVEELKWLYHGEVATQRSDTGSGDYSANYWLLEGGIALNYVTARLGYEVLGSDNSAYGFATPLATLHKFNGWADQFIGTPSQGLVDTYLSFSGGFAGGNWLIALHDFDTDEGTPLVENLGREIDFQYTRKFFENYTLGIKYASYSNGDAASGKVDTDKLWVWLSAAF